MKQKIIFIMCVVFLAGLCSCGVNSNENSQTPEEVSEIVTGSAITAIFKNSESTVKKARLENDYVRIWEKNVPSGKWVQENLDGTNRITIDLKEEDIDILWLTNDWLYYTIYYAKKDNDVENVVGNSAVYRVPLIQDAVPMYDLKNKEALVQTENFVASPTEFMVTDSYMFYTDISKDGDNITYQYDFETKKSVAVLENEYYNILIDEVTQMPLTIGNTLFAYRDTSVFHNDLRIYRISMDDPLEKKSIYSEKSGDERGCSPAAFVMNNCLYFVNMDCNSIMKYDGDSEEVTCVVDDNTLQNIVEELKLIDGDGYNVERNIKAIHVWDNKLYINLDIEWLSKEIAVDGEYKGQKIKVEHYRDLLLFSDSEDLEQWTMEERLQDYVTQNSMHLIYSEADSNGYIKSSNTQDSVVTIWMLFENKVFFEILQNEKYTVMIYDVETGEVERMNSDDYRFSWYYHV